MHNNSMQLFNKFALEYFDQKRSVLEIGPDKNPSTLKTLVGDRNSLWSTLDVSDWLAATTYIAESMYSFPIEDDAFDIVVSANVIEHVQNIWKWMDELARICTPGGYIITINPVSWPYHEAPVDCWRIYPEGMKALSENAGLNVVLSTWKSVELEETFQWLPERFKTTSKLQELRPLLVLAARTMKRGFQGAFDTITIAQRPL